MRTYLMHFNFKQKVVLIEEVGLFEYTTNGSEKFYKFDFDLYNCEKSIDDDFDVKIFGNYHDLKKLLFLMQLK